MSEALMRVESAVTATASGDLSWGRWTHDCAVALGLSGQRNPLGFAVVRYLSASSPSAMSAWDVVMHLAGEMERRGLAPDPSNRESAFQAFEFWREPHCRTCGGRGSVDGGARVCPTCKGSGERKTPAGPDAVRLGIECLMDAQSWMEAQLASRMRRSG